MSKLQTSTFFTLFSLCLSLAYCKSFIEDTDAYNHLPYFANPNYYKQEHLTLPLGSKAHPYTYGIVGNGTPVRGFISNNQDENENYQDIGWVLMVPSHYFGSMAPDWANVKHGQKDPMNPQTPRAWDEDE